MLKIKNRRKLEILVRIIKHPPTEVGGLLLFTKCFYCSDIVALENVHRVVAYKAGEHAGCVFLFNFGQCQVCVYNGGLLAVDSRFDYVVQLGTDKRC